MAKEGTKLCKHCKTEIPAAAKVCPNCRKKQGGIVKWIVIVIVVLGVIGAASSGGNDNSEPKQASNTNVSNSITKNDDVTESKSESETQIESEKESEEIQETQEETISEDEYKSLCEEYSYKDVLRNPEDYVGNKIKITLKISTVHEAGITNPTKYYFAYSKSDYGWYGDRYAIYDKRAEQDPKLLTDDIITVWGEIADPEQTSSLIISSEELFVINMKYVELVSE